MKRSHKLLYISAGIPFVIEMLFIARWYRDSPAFSHFRQYSFDWAAAWFFGLVEGAGVSTLTFLVICAVVVLVRWVWKDDTRQEPAKETK